jgi:hypothetical protein
MHHPDLANRVPARISKSMSLVTERAIRKWHKECWVYCETKWKGVGSPGLLEDPRRIFNADETGFALDAGTGRVQKVLAERGAKNVPRVAPGTKKQVTMTNNKKM